MTGVVGGFALDVVAVFLEGTKKGGDLTCQLCCILVEAEPLLLRCECRVVLDPHSRHHGAHTI